MSKVIHFQDWLHQNPQNSLESKELFLSEEQVRSFPQFIDSTPQEVENIIVTLHDLALVSYAMFCREDPQEDKVRKAA